MSSMLFAEISSTTTIWLIAIAVVVAMVFFGILIPLASRYKRCPSNRVLVIYGKYTGSPSGTRCLHGGARMVLSVPAAPA